MYFDWSFGYMNQVLNDNATLEDLIHFIEQTVSTSPAKAPAKFGCMMANTSLDTKTITPKIEKNVKKYRQMILDHYVSFLQRLKKQKKLKADLDIHNAAEFIVGSFWGAMAISRLYKDRSIAKPQMHMLIETIKGWAV